jgi:hypothetical protein
VSSMRHDCETRQCRRVKFLIQHPVADDVPDIVGHHGEHKVMNQARKPGWRIAAWDRLVDGDAPTTFRITL